MKWNEGSWKMERGIERIEGEEWRSKQKGESMGGREMEWGRRGRREIDLIDCRLIDKD